jgi:glycosyltransferase involved in cell wall biosynthesis
MRILLVCSGNKGEASPFIREQAAQLENAGCSVEFFLIRGKGWLGYLKNRGGLIKKIQEFEPDIVHAHSGMSALLAGTQRIAPVVATFHGSDVNIPKLRFFTHIASWLSKAQIVVSAEMKQILGNPNLQIIPCAVDTTLFYPMDQLDAKKALGWSNENHYVLFSSSFDNAIKNATLAKESVDKLHDSKVILIELKGKSRNQVVQMMNACDVALMTSLSEGSPQFVKEALACGTPVVSTRVGDVADLSSEVPGNYMVGYDVAEIAEALRTAIEFRKSYGRTNGPAIIQRRGLTPIAVAIRLMDVYKSVNG